jgi:hypothetical protein
VYSHAVRDRNMDSIRGVYKLHDLFTTFTHTGSPRGYHLHRHQNVVVFIVTLLHFIPRRGQQRGRFDQWSSLARSILEPEASTEDAVPSGL